MLHENNNFNTIGAMIDCSRNAVMTVEQLKKYITILSKMGYNQIHLYMEDTYEVDGEKFFGYLRGKYSKKELRELDDFAYGLGVELVPNVQTLAHLATFLKWRPEIADTGDILLVGDGAVYDLIKRMFSSLRQCFRTDKIHIGMDEAHMLGRGKYYDLHGTENRFDILLSHLQKVCALADEFGFKPMMWSDMFYRLANGGNYYSEKGSFDRSISDKIPANATLVYWDYYSTDKKRYECMIKGHKQLTDKIIFAGGAWKWLGFAPNNYYSLKSTKAAITSCIKCGIKELLMTAWGDNGGECSAYAVLPTLCYASCIARGITKMQDVKEVFKSSVGVEFDDFMKLDLPNLPEKADAPINPSKYMLYTDCFMSTLNSTVKQGDGARFASAAKKLRNSAKRAGEYSYIFETLSKLCFVLEIKAEICNKTRDAYNNKNNNEIDSVISDYKKMIKRTEDFYKTFKKQWFTENKPHGFDVQDIRIGGLIYRMRSCLDRLTEYRNGNIKNIPELDEELIQLSTERLNYNNWINTVSTNSI